MRGVRACAWCCCSALALALSACGKTHYVEATSNAGAPSTGGTDIPGPMDQTGSIGGRGMAGDSPTEPVAGCATDVPASGAPPLSRLDGDAVNNAVRELLPKAAAEPPFIPAGALPQNGPTTPSDVDALHALAHAVALELASGEASKEWRAGCDPVKQGAEVCRDKLVEPLLERIYRRPLTDEDREELAAVFASGQKLGGTFESGIRAVVEVALQSPDFLYAPEKRLSNCPP